MITPNQNNYEEFIIDYIDGRLSAEEIAELLLFLEQNISIKAEFELLISSSMPLIDKVKYHSKDQLKKSSNVSYEAIVAYLENDLNPDEKSKIENELIKDKLLKKEYDFIKKTKLIPDISIVYSAKKKLRRENKIIHLFSYAAAASLIFFLIYNTFILRSDIFNQNKIKKLSEPKSSMQSINTRSTYVVKSKKSNLKQIKPNKDIITSRTNNQQHQLSELSNLLKLSNNTTNQQPEVKEDIYSVISSSEYSPFVKNAFEDEYDDHITTVFAQTQIIEKDTNDSDTELTLIEIARKKVKEYLTEKTGYAEMKSADGNPIAYEFKAGEFEFYKTIKSK